MTRPHRFLTCMHSQQSLNHIQCCFSKPEFPRGKPDNLLTMVLQLASQSELLGRTKGQNYIESAFARSLAFRNAAEEMDIHAGIGPLCIECSESGVFCNRPCLNRSGCHSSQGSLPVEPGIPTCVRAARNLAWNANGCAVRCCPCTSERASRLPSAKSPVVSRRHREPGGGRFHTRSTPTRLRMVHRVLSCSAWPRTISLGERSGVGGGAWRCCGGVCLPPAADPRLA